VPKEKLDLFGGETSAALTGSASRIILARDSLPSTCKAAANAPRLHGNFATARLIDAFSSVGFQSG
jgi:hypothetical protein